MERREALDILLRAAAAYAAIWEKEINGTLTAKTADVECASLASDMASLEDLMMARDILRAIEVWAPLTQNITIRLGPHR